MELTFLDRSYNFQLAPENTVEWRWPSRPRHSEEFYNPYRESYLEICGHNYRSWVKKGKIIVLKPRTEEIAESWVDLQYGYGIVGKEKMQLGTYRARSMSQDNANEAMVSILISTEVVTKIANFKPMPGSIVTKSMYTRSNVLFQQHPKYFITQKTS